MNNSWDFEKLKIDPYEPCPCGSNKKFKFCCYQKAREAKHKKKGNNYSVNWINHIAYKMWEDADFEICLGFDKDKCKPLIKEAHTIQNNRILNRIAENGHLYKIESKYTDDGFVPFFKKISRNKASTFLGFCEYHDTKIFEPIEKRDYCQDAIQNFLFAFRAFAFEYHKKHRLQHHLQSSFKMYPESAFDLVWLNTYRVNQLDIIDYEKNYEIFKREYVSKKFDTFRTIYRKLNYEVEFAASGCFAVQYDLNGKLMNDIYFDKSDNKMPSIYVNIYPIESGTNIILSYHLDDDNVYGEYFNQLENLTIDELVNYLNYLIIEYTENVYFSPPLIEKMTDKQKESLLRSFSSSVNLLEKLNLILEGNYYQFNIFKSSTFN